MSKKKVLYVITKGNWGGAQRYVFDLATGLPKDEFEVAVALGEPALSAGKPGLLADKLKSASVMIYYISSLGRDVSFGKDTTSFFELYRLFKKEKPDIVHLNSSKAGGVGALAARVAGVPRIIFTAHGWPFWEQRNFLMRGAIWFFSWLTALLSHTVIVISDYDLRVARRMPFVSRKTVRIYNGIGLETLGTGKMIRSAFPPGAVITGTIGELNKNKNQQVLIEQAKNNSSMFVAIVGEGEERGHLEEKIKKYNLNDRLRACKRGTAGLRRLCPAIA